MAIYVEAVPTFSDRLSWVKFRDFLWAFMLEARTDFKCIIFNLIADR
jgi:hypothetical protein